VADLLREVSGDVEVIWNGAQAIPALFSPGGALPRYRRRGAAVLPERSLDAALDVLRKNQARLTSVTPVRATLEDYFLARIGETKPNEVSA